MQKRIIIVEDETLLLKALNIELLSAGFQVLSATDGETGLKIVQDEKPDLVLLDLILPKMSGFEVLGHLKENKETKNIPVIILSNLGQKEEQMRGLKLGAVDYFIKSNTDLNLVVKQIDAVLKK